MREWVADNLPAGWRTQTALHEAAHAAAALRFNRPVDQVRIDRPDYDTIGQLIPAEFDGALDWRDVLISLVGYLAVDTPGWPPTWPIHPDELEGLGIFARNLQLTRDEYEQLVEKARALLDDPEFRLVMHAIQRALLTASPVITGDELIALRDAVVAPLTPAQENPA